MKPGLPRRIYDGLSPECQKICRFIVQPPDGDAGHEGNLPMGYKEDVPSQTPKFMLHMRGDWAKKPSKL